jgi:hypothetical protein
LALKVYSLNLVFEAGACIEGVFEVGLVQGENFDLIAGGNAGRVPRLIDDEGALAKEISHAQGRNEPLFGFCPAPVHVDGTVTDQEECLARLSLPDDDLVFAVTAALHLLGDVGELGGREMLEQVYGA